MQSLSLDAYQLEPENEDKGRQPEELKVIETKEPQVAEREKGKEKEAEDEFSRLKEENESLKKLVKTLREKEEEQTKTVEKFKSLFLEDSDDEEGEKEKNAEAKKFGNTALTLSPGHIVHEALCVDAVKKPKKRLFVICTDSVKLAKLYSEEVTREIPFRDIYSWLVTQSNSLALFVVPRPGLVDYVADVPRANASLCMFAIENARDVINQMEHAVNTLAKRLGKIEPPWYDKVLDYLDERIPEIPLPDILTQAILPPQTPPAQPPQQPQQPPAQQPQHDDGVPWYEKVFHKVADGLDEASAAVADLLDAKKGSTF